MRVRKKQSRLLLLQVPIQYNDTKIVQDTGVEKPVFVNWIFYTIRNSTPKRQIHTNSIAFVENANRKTNTTEIVQGGYHSRSSSRQHFMPLRLGTHAERDGEQHGKNHNQTNLQRALTRDKIQDRGRPH